MLSRSNYVHGDVGESNLDGRSNDGRAFPFSNALKNFSDRVTRKLVRRGYRIADAYSVIRPMEKVETVDAGVQIEKASWVYADRGSARSGDRLMNSQFFVFIAWPVAVTVLFMSAPWRAVDCFSARSGAV